jgi:tRNA nucleotidyltransferase/poly(A) polymerase
MAKEADKSTALAVLRQLRDAGYQALFAGGCVRDMLLETRPKDYDIATDATPQQVAELFDRTLMVGAKFGVAIVLRRGRMVEVATFRSDVSYSDGRRPDEVVFSTPRDDAERRDFTINGMFYDPLSEEVIDYVGGRGDLAAGVIRTIGSPRQRFAEDYLRMLRAVRFATRLGFRLEADTAAAIRRTAPRIAEISGERIADEMTRMLAEPSAVEALQRLREMRLARQVLPEFFDSNDVWPVAMRRVEAVAEKKDPILTIGALLMNLSAGAIRRLVKRWGASNELRDALLYFSAHRHAWRKAADMNLAGLKRILAGKEFDRLRTLWSIREDIETGEQTQARRIARRIGSIDAKKIAPAPYVTGADLKELGLVEGPLLGKVHRKLYDLQLNEQLPSRRAALGRAKKLVATEQKKLARQAEAFPDKPAPGQTCPTCGRTMPRRRS